MSFHKQAFLAGYMDKVAGPLGVLGSFTSGFMQSKAQQHNRKIDNLYSADQKDNPQLAQHWEAEYGKSSPNRAQFEAGYQRVNGQAAPTSFQQSRDMYQQTLNRRNTANNGAGAPKAPGLLGYNDWQNNAQTRAYLKGNPKVDPVASYNQQIGAYNAKYGTQYAAIQDQKSYLARPDTQKYVQYLMQQTPGMTPEQANGKAYQAGIQAHAAKYATSIAKTVAPAKQATPNPSNVYTPPQGVDVNKVLGIGQQPVVVPIQTPVQGQAQQPVTQPVNVGAGQPSSPAPELPEDSAKGAMNAGDAEQEAFSIRSQDAASRLAQFRATAQVQEQARRQAIKSPYAQSLQSNQYGSIVPAKYTSRFMAPLPGGFQEFVHSFGHNGSL